MDLSARYVTQASVYDRFQIGRRLTDRTIAKRQKQGWYGNGMIALQRKEKIKRQRQKRNWKELLADFV